MLLKIHSFGSLALPLFGFQSKLAEKRLYRIREMETNQFEAFYEIVRLIPEGKVATYGDVAHMAGSRAARHVGYALAGLSDDNDVPWQRVINSKGEVSPRRNGEGHFIQRILLEEEGVVFNENGRISLKKYRWIPED